MSLPSPNGLSRNHQLWNVPLDDVHEHERTPPTSSTVDNNLTKR